MIAEHTMLDELEGRLLRLPEPAKENGSVVLVVVRPEVDARQTPPRCILSPENGVEGDRWAAREPRADDNQITVMRADVARLVGNGQPLSTPGDNLMVDLDLSETNLPAGTTLRIGTALCEVTPKPHRGCSKFAARFGHDALRLTAIYDDRRLRGLHLRVLEAGEVGPGDAIDVVARGYAPAAGPAP